MTRQALGLPRVLVVAPQLQPVCGMQLQETDLDLGRGIRLV